MIIQYAMKIKVEGRSQNMDEIKRVIMSRIKDIIDLEALSDNPEQKQRLIMKQRNTQLQRNAQEMRLLVSLDSYAYDQQSVFDHIFPSIYDICHSYDPAIKIESNQSSRKKIYGLLKQFFSKQDYWQKLTMIKSMLRKNNFIDPPMRIFNWLSEWSKKKYMENVDIGQTNYQKKIERMCMGISSVIINEKVEDTINLYQNQLRKYSQPLYFQQSKQSNKISNKKKIPLISESSLQLTRIKSYSNLQQKSRYLTLYNKQTFYCYIVDQLIQYYKLTQISGLDKNYVKSIRKKKLKDSLVMEENQKKIIYALVQYSTNKDIKNIIKQYQQNYKIYQEQQKLTKIPIYPNQTKPIVTALSPTKFRKQSIPLIPQTKRSTWEATATITAARTQNSATVHHNINKKINDLNDNLQKLLKERKPNLYLPMMSIRACKNTKKQKNTLQLISINSQSPQKQTKFKTINQQPHSQHSIQLSIPNRSSKKLKIKLPQISRSLDQQQKSREQRTCLIKFPTQSQQNTFLKQDKPENNSNNTHHQKLKIMQKPAIKGMIIKNLLSNREKNNKSKNYYMEDEMQNHERNQFLCIQNHHKSTNVAEKANQEEKNPESPQIRSLKQKTNSILRNCKVYQYL